MRYLKIDTATSGDAILVPAESGKKIRVHQYTAIANGAVGMAFRDTGGLQMTGVMSIAAAGGVVSAQAAPTYQGQWGVFETNVGQGLVLNLSAAVQVSGHFAYTIINV